MRCDRGISWSGVLLLLALIVWIGWQAQPAANAAGAEGAGKPISLAGQWNFRLDPEDRGIEE